MATQAAGNSKYQTVVSDRLEKFVADLPVNRSPFDSWGLIPPTKSIKSLIGFLIVPKFPTVRCYSGYAYKEVQVLAKWVLYQEHPLCFKLRLCFDLLSGTDSSSIIPCYPEGKPQNNHSNTSRGPVSLPRLYCTGCNMLAPTKLVLGRRFPIR